MMMNAACQRLWILIRKRAMRSSVKLAAGQQICSQICPDAPIPFQIAEWI